MSFKEKLKAYAKEIGVVALGVTGTKPISGEAELIYRRRIERGFLSGGNVPYRGFEEKNLKQCFDPKQSFPSAKSLISIAVPYKISYSQETKPEYHGYLARVGWGRDYHLVVREKIKKLCKFIRNFFPEVNFRTMVDNGPLLERGFAARAGLGWIGKNNTLIVPNVGSFVYLGEILLDIELEEDAPLNIDCGECTDCLKACPTGALVEPYMLNVRTCISFLTQIPELPEDWIFPHMDRMIYGCDICQEVCPFNKSGPSLGDPAFFPERFLPYHDLIDLISMDVKRYTEVIGQTSAEWVGRDTMQKNAIVALAHYDDPGILPYLRKLQKDERPLIKNAAIQVEKRLRK